jgi:predicted nucleic-acid-binding protein
MIAIDTNVLLRRLLNDDPVQSTKARKIFEKNNLILITDIVLVETIWILKGKRYKASKEDICEVIMKLLEESNVVFENQQAIWNALNDYIDAPVVKTSDGNNSADFPDALTVNKAKVLAKRWSMPYDVTYTFDPAAQALDGTMAA